jgi:phage-related protein
MWSYEFYRDRKGEEPVREFILSLNKKARGKVLQAIQILAEFGPTLPFPYSSQVEGKLRELRAHYGNALYRLLYYQATDGTFILLHAFEKTTAKVPEREKRIARERMKEHQARKGEI